MGQLGVSGPPAGFVEASRALADELGLPIVLPTGAFIADPSVAWLMEAVEDWHLYARVPRHDPGWFHASALGQSDETLIALYRGEEQPRHAARTLRVFDNGTSRDRDWKRYFRRAGLLEGTKAGRRVRFPSLRLTGECDALVRDGQGGRWVVEVKTINPYDFGRLTAPKPDHVQQLTVYLTGLGVDSGIVLYESKGDQAVKLFRVDRDAGLWDEIVTRLRRLRREAESG